MEEISDLDSIYRDLLSHCRVYGTRLLGWEDHHISKRGILYFLQVTYADGEYGIVVVSFNQAEAVHSLYLRMLERFHARPHTYRRVGGGA